MAVEFAASVSCDDTEINTAADELEDDWLEVELEISEMTMRDESITNAAEMASMNARLKTMINIRTNKPNQNEKNVRPEIQ
jgi:hypothetical protein